MPPSDAVALDNSFGLRLALRQVQRAAVFSGRSTRTEVIAYWAFALISELVISLIALVIWNVASWNSMRFYTALAIVFAIPEPALFVRRLHDQGRSGWWAVVGIPFAAFSWFGGPRADRPLWEHLIVAFLSITILVFLLWPGVAETNRFGPDPRLGHDDATTVTE